MNTKNETRVITLTDFGKHKLPNDDTIVTDYVVISTVNTLGSVVPILVNDLMVHPNQAITFEGYFVWDQIEIQYVDGFTRVEDYEPIVNIAYNPLKEQSHEH